MVFNVVPTALEVVMVSSILSYKCGPPLGVLTLGTLAAYVAFTFGVTKVRAGKGSVGDAAPCPGGRMGSCGAAERMSRQPCVTGAPPAGELA